MRGLRHYTLAGGEQAGRKEGNQEEGRKAGRQERKKGPSMLTVKTNMS